MAIDQAELEHKLNIFKRDVEDMEEAFKEIEEFDRRAKEFTSNLSLFSWAYDKFKKRYMKSSIEKMTNIISINEEINKTICNLRTELDNNLEAVSEMDRKTEISLRETLTDSKEFLLQVESLIGKYDEFLGSFLGSQSSEHSVQKTEDSNTRLNVFRRLFRRFF